MRWATLVKGHIEEALDPWALQTGFTDPKYGRTLLADGSVSPIVIAYG
jgi:hypothetical protein